MRQDLEFVVGDKVFVKISPYCHWMRFRHKGKLTPRFVRSYKILEHMGKVAYRLALLASIDRMYNVFHMSLLHKYLYDQTHMLKVKDVELRDDLVYEESLV